MPLPNNAYQPLFPMQETIFEKTTGLPLAAGKVSFFQDQARTVPKSVYERTENPDNTFTYTDIGNVLTLSSIGTFVDDGGNNFIPFLWPFVGLPTDTPPSTVVQLYYIIVESSGSTSEFTVSAWPPGVESGSAPSGNEFISSTNVVSNPQFAVVDFASPAVFNVSGNSTIEIAPDWSIITTGTGSVTVNQIAETDTTAPGLPAFGLNITSSGISTLLLSQKISMSPRILETGYASGTFIVESTTGLNPTISMQFSPSSPANTPVTIASGIATEGGYTQFSGTVNLQDLTINTDPGNTGFVYVQFVIPTAANINLSCVQLISVSAAGVIAEYIQESTPRQIDHLFHYFQPKINYKPIPSLLTGWDFPLNPAQFTTQPTYAATITTASGGTVGSYIIDQTIMGAAVNTMNFVYGAADQLQITSTGDTDAFYMLQYLQGGEAMETALTRLSVNINAFASATGVTAQVYLFNGNLSSTIPMLTTTIGSIASTGVFTLTAANWVPVLQFNGQGNSSSLGTSSQDFGFSGFDATQYYGLTQNFAIVVTFSIPVSGTTVNINSISCVPGDIPTRPAPQSSDEVLRECQYYYEKSYDSGVLVPTATTSSALIYQLSNYSVTTPGGSSSVYPEAFSIEFVVAKRSTNPTVILYPTAGTLTANTIYAQGNFSDATQQSGNVAINLWTLFSKGSKSINYFASTYSSIFSHSASSSAGFIALQYSCDARLGVV